MRRYGLLGRFGVVLLGKALFVPCAIAQTGPDPDLIAYWSLDEPVRGVVGDSAGRSHGTHYSVPDVGVPGRCGTAYSFDGVDDGLTILNNLGSFGDGEFTITAWVKLTSIPQVYPTSAIFVHYAGVPVVGLDVDNASGKPGFGMRDANSFVIETEGDSPINDGQWHFLAGVRGGGTAFFYVDGDLVDCKPTGPLGTVTGGPSYVRIGAVTTGLGHLTDPVPRESFFEGLIDEVKVYSRALSSQEILGEFQNPCPARDPDHLLISWWNLDEPSGTAVADSAGTSHGTNGGAAVGAAGVCGTAYSFDGVSGGLSLNNNLGNFGQGNFTITAWVRPSALPQPPGGQTIFVHYAPGNTGLGINTTTGQPQFGMADPTGGLLLLYDAPDAINDDGWHYLAAVRNGGRSTLYVDGVYAQSATNSNLGDVTAGGPSYVRIGGVYTGPGHLTSPLTTESLFHGLIDEVKVYGVALTAEEIGALYANPCGLGAPPIAIAGENQSAHPGDVVTLDGSDSFDDDTEILLFAWSFVSVPAGSTAVLSGADTDMPTFLVDLLGTYVIQLVVTDGAGLSSEPAEVTVSSQNLPPTASAGEDQGGVAGFPIGLDGSASSDPDEDPITFAWSFFETPAGSAAALSGATTATPSLVPDLPGVYVVRLVVHDGFEPSEPDDVRVTVISGAEFAENATMDALELVVALPASSVTTSGNQRALGNFLSQAIEALQIGDLATAQHKLAQAIGRTDGCALRGAPDGNGPGRDWITSCADQQAAYDLLQQALAAIQ